MDPDRNPSLPAITNGETYSIMADIHFYLATPYSAFAGSFVYQRELKYRATAAGSHISCRKKAMEKIESLVTDELLTYLAAQPALRAFQLRPDQMRNLAGSMLRKEILVERWQDRSYYLKSRIVADPSGYLDSAEVLRGLEEGVRDLETAKARAENALGEVRRAEERLELAKAKVQFFRELAKPESESDAAHLLEKGLALLKAGDYRGAVGIYERLIQNDPVSEKAYLNRGAAYFYLHEYQKAKEDFTHVIGLDPGNALAHNNRGSAYVELGKLDQAREDYDRALQLAPENGFSYYNRGLASLKSGSDYSSSIKDFDKAIELIQDDYEAFLNRGVAHAKLGQYPEAVEDYGRAIKLNPHDARAYYNKANALFRSGNQSRAVKDYTKALELDPDHVDAYYNRAMDYCKLGDFERAIADYDRYLKVNSQDARAFLYRGFLHSKMGEDSLAIEDWVTAAELGDERGLRRLHELGVEPDL
jgi:tetratricopeptide (TPR) repeat protein